MPIVRIAGTVFQSTTCAREAGYGRARLPPELQSRSQNRGWRIPSTLKFACRVALSRQLSACQLLAVSWQLSKSRRTRRSSAASRRRAACAGSLPHGAEAA